jgi:hypothetical protein
VVEAQELIEIHAGLKSREDAHLADLLRKYIGGTALRNQETPLTSLARNTGFHLWFVSNAAKCDMPIDLAPPADATIRTNAYSIAVECKRLFSPRKVEQNIRKGFQQLQERYKQYDGRTEIYGALALSLGKLDECLIEARDEADLRARFASVVRSCASRSKAMPENVTLSAGDAFIAVANWLRRLSVGSLACRRQGKSQ